RRHARRGRARRFEPENSEPARVPLFRAQRPMGESQQAHAGHRLMGLTRIAAFAALAWAAVTLAPAAHAEDGPGLARLVQSGDRARALATIRASADVNAAQPDGTTPLHWAVYRVDHELVAELLARGAKVDVANRFGARPLGEAVNTADVALVELLLDAGADVESPNEDGQTALMLAARSGSLPVAKLLVEHGANVNAVERWRQQTPLMWAA